MTSIKRSWANAMAAILALALIATPSNPSFAQSSATPIKGVSYVTLAIANNANERGRIKHFQNSSSVILLDRDNLAPEALATMLNAYVMGLRHGGGPGKNAMVRPTPQAGHQLTPRQRAHYQAILTRLQLAAERVVPGVGKVQAIDVPLVGGP